MDISNKVINIDTLNIYTEKQAISQEIQQVKNEIQNELNGLFSELLDSAVANDSVKDTSLYDDSSVSSDTVDSASISSDSGSINIGTVNIYLNDILEQIENDSTSAEPTTKSIQTTDFSSLPFNVPTEYRSIIDNMSNKYNVDSKVVASVIFAESTFKPNAVSSSGAEGLMQLMPNTAKYLGVSDSFDVNQNIEGGVKYLSQMLNKYDNNLSLALAAYNAGPGNVDKYKGVPPFEETQNYVKKITNFLV